VRWPASLHAVADRATNGRSRPPSQPSRRHLAVPLRRDRRINRRAWRREGRHHTVARVLKQPAAVRLNPPPHTSSWAASAARIPWASASHRRVEPSTSVNRNVTTPEGAAARAADTPAESHNRQAPTSHIGGSGPVNSSLVSARRSRDNHSGDRPGGESSAHEGRCDVEENRPVRDPGVDHPRIPPGSDFEYDEAHDVPAGPRRRDTPATHRVEPSKLADIVQSG
jgi:hypothetical protein